MIKNNRLKSVLDAGFYYISYILLQVLLVLYLTSYTDLSNSYILYVVFLFLFIPYTINYFRSDCAIEKIPISYLIKLSFIGIVLNLFFGFLFSFIPVSNSYVESMDLIFGVPVTLTIFVSCFIVPFIEEYLFRYLIFNSFLDCFSFRISLVFQSLLFALIHGSLVEGLYAFIVGLFLGFLYHKNNHNFLVPVIVHISMNITSCLLMFIL